MRGRSILLMLSVAAAMMVASIATRAQEPAAAQKVDPAVIAHGQEVYAAQRCSLCHAIDGKGNAKGVLDGVGSKLKAEDIRAWIVTPKEMAEKAKATRTPPMRAYPSLPKADLDALVAYLFSLKAK